MPGIADVNAVATPCPLCGGERTLRKRKDPRWPGGLRMRAVCQPCDSARNHVAKSKGPALYSSPSVRRLEDYSNEEFFNALCRLWISRDEHKENTGV